MDKTFTEEQVVKTVTNIVGEALDKVSKDFNDKMEGKLAEVAAASKAYEDKKAADAQKAELAVNNASVRKGVDYSKSIKYINCLLSKDVEGMKALGLKALNSDSDSQGGFLVPEEFSTMVSEIRLNVGLARKLARYVPMKTAIKHMPIMDSDVVVYWVTQGAAKPQSTFTLGSVELTARTLVGLCLITNELLDDSDIDMLQFIAMRFGQALAKEEDKQMLVGTGAPFVGILNLTGTNLVSMSAGNVAVTQVTVDDLNQVRFSLEETIMANAKWVMHRNILRIIMSIKENSQSIVSFANPVVTSDYRGGLIVPSAMLLGHEVYTSSQMPSTVAAGGKFLIFGDFGYFYFGERKGQVMKVSSEATIAGVNLFETNSVGVLLEERIAEIVSLPAAFTCLATAAS